MDILALLVEGLFYIFSLYIIMSMTPLAVPIVFTLFLVCIIGLLYNLVEQLIIVFKDLKHSVIQSWTWLKSMTRHLVNSPFKLWDKLMVFIFEIWSCVTYHLGFEREVRDSKQISLKLLVDKKKNRVLFAESGNDFVDVLFSFLTLPMGTIVRLAGKKSGIGSLDDLYKSVEALSQDCYQTEACKTMLLHPRSAYAVQCQNLAVNIHETDHIKHYICSNKHCSKKMGLRLASAVKNAICSCREPMDKDVYLNCEDGNANDNGVFVKGTGRFMISDDLQVLTISISNSLSLLRILGYRDGTAVEERHVNIGIKEVLHLLRRSVISKSPLTDVFLSEDEEIASTTSPESRFVQSNHQMQKCSSNKKIKVKLLVSKLTKNILSVEAKEDFIDLLFSFLTFPLGSIIKLLKGHSSLGSIDNLYNSAKNLSTNDYMRSSECKNMILSPKVANKYGWANQLLPIEEEAPMEVKGYKCFTCFSRGKSCRHSRFQELEIMNPKKEGFTKQQRLLLVTDNLVVEPLSPVSGMHLLNNLNVPFNDLEELSVTMGEEEALALLKTSLVSTTVLSHVFNPQVLSQGTSPNMVESPAASLAHNAQEVSSSDISASGEVNLNSFTNWRSIWRLKAAPEVKHFLWSACSDALPTEENLYKKNCTSTPFCTLCKVEVETIKHLLLTCRWARTVWSGSNLGYIVDLVSLTTFQEWWTKVMEGSSSSSNSDKFKTTVAYLCWYIWKARNEARFKNVGINPRNTVTQASEAVLYFWNSTKNTQKQHTPSANRSPYQGWSPPRPDILKINFAVALVLGSTEAGVGIVVRDHSGSLVDGVAKTVKASRSVVVAEVKAVRQVLLLAKTKMYSQIAIETDSKIIYDLVNLRTKTSQEVDALISEITALQEGFQEVSWSLILQSANKVAEWVAKKARNNALPPSWTDQIPISLESLLISDFLHVFS